MIRQLVLCIALIGSQIAGQAVCQCHAHAHDHQHDGLHEHQACSTHQHHTTFGQPDGATQDAPLHHECDCHEGSPELLVQRSFQLPDDSSLVACLTLPVSIVATMNPSTRGLSVFECDTSSCRLSVRADLGTWLL
ncbi:MAG: hypothetical protein ACR2NP_01385 [Pirellulaceae bacterium]